MAANAPRVQWLDRPCVNCDTGGVLINCPTTRASLPVEEFQREYLTTRAFGSASAGAGLRPDGSVTK
jgi:hypothetical protein